MLEMIEQKASGKHIPIEPINSEKKHKIDTQGCKKSIDNFLSHWFIQLFMTIITVYALLGDDFRLLFFSKASDDTFTMLTFASMILFLLELVLASVGKPDYFNSFFFWLDLFSTISLITDIEFIMNALTGGGDQADSADAASLARASRGARIGTRAGRMTRVIRLIRLIRIVKLYKSANQAMVNQEKSKNQIKDLQMLGDKNNQVNTDINIQELLMKDQKESVVGKKLLDYTTRRVVILVLAMLFSVPIFSVSTYLSEPDSFGYGLGLVKQLGPNT